MSKNWLHWLFLCSFLLGTAVIIPFSSLGFVLPKLPFYAIAAAFGVLIVKQNDTCFAPTLCKTWIGRMFLIFWIIVFFSIAWSVAPLLSIVGSAPRFEGMITHIIFLSFALIGLAMMRSKQKLLLRTILWSNVIIVAYGTFQMLQLDPLSFSWQGEAFLGRIFSTIGQPNILGQFVLLTVPFVIFFASKQKNMPLMILSVLNAVILLQTASRAALLGGIAALLLFLIINNNQMWRFMNPRRCICGGIVVTMIIITGLFSFSQRFSVTTQDGFSLGARGVIWRDAVHMIAARPLGYGLETTGIASPKFTKADFYEHVSLFSEWNRAHSKPLDLLLTVGPLGMIAFYLFLILLLIGLMRLKGSHTLALPCAIALFGESIAVLAGFDTVVTHVLFWLIAGMSLGIVLQNQESPAPRFRRQFTVMLAIVNLLIALVFFQWNGARIELVRSDINLVRGDVAESIMNASKAVDRFPQDRTLLIRALERGLTGWEQTNNQESIAKLEELTTDLLQKLQSLSGTHDGTTDSLRAWQSALRGDATQAQFSIESSITKRPTSVLALRIAWHAADILEDQAKVNAYREQMTSLLPPFWNDMTSERGRILRKEHPWLEELL